ncbi:WD40 repeat-like protein [Peniophora sp. CONT]|nr:WD40 repeat-like protein [Peniophora sp. CONT]
MLRAKQRLSAAFSRPISHSSDEQTAVGTPLQSLASAVLITAISVNPTDVPTISRKLSIFVNGQDIAGAGHVFAISRHTTSLTWSVTPPLHIMPENELEIQFHRKRSMKHPGRRLADSIHLPAASVIAVYEGSNEPDQVYEHTSSTIRASVTLRRTTPTTFTPEAVQIHTLSSEELRRGVTRNSSKVFTRVLLRTHELQRIDNFEPHALDISELENAAKDVIEPIETCPVTVFNVLEAIAKAVELALALLVSPACHDRPRTCPRTVAGILALALNAYTLIKDMGGPGPVDAVSPWLQDMSNRMILALRRTMRSLEGRKDEVVSLVYDSDDAPSQHNEPRPKSSDSRSTLSRDQDKLIELLDPHFLPTGYPTSLCMEDTRVDILHDVEKWLDDFEAPNLLWVRGGPGMGKNTLVWTIANMLERRQRNASFFFFRHQHYTPLDLWRTVACSLAWYHPALKASVSANLDASRDNLSHDISRLFQALVAKPLRDHSQAMREGGVAPVIVIGSLDACIQTDKRQWRGLLQTLVQWLDLPKECKLVFTSCHHEAIEECLDDPLRTKVIDLVPEDSHQDIITYIQRRALSIQATLGVHPSEVVTLDHRHLARLATHAAGFFLWARAAMDYIAFSADPPRALETLVAKGLYQKLDDVDDKFDGLLEDAFDGVKPPGFRATLGALSLARRPVSITELQDLLGSGFAQREPAAICARLSSVLTVADAHNQRLRIYHSAFTAYLTDSRRAGLRYEAFLVEPERAQRRLARSCLQLMLDPDRGLHFNMHGHKSSYINDTTLDDESLSQALPSSLEYACQFFHEHLLSITDHLDADMLQHLNDLFRVKLLFWLEVMSDLGIVESAVQAMTLVSRRFRDQDPDLANIASEAARFVLVHMDAIAASAPHVYSSALTFLPSTSVLYSLYSHLFVGIPRVVVDQPLRLQPVRAVYNRQCVVKSVCVSPDGAWMLVALQPDSQSTSAVLQKVDLHTGVTISTSAAVDGSILDAKLYMDGEKYCAATAVTDGTVKLWRLDDDIEIFATLKEHEDYVRCVDVDQSSTMLVSGADDCTLILWSTITTKPVGKPLTGHKDWIRAVLFSEDGQKIISGSDDKSIRIWDAATGVELRRIYAHGSPVRSMALCASGLISGGDDGTIVLTALDTGSELKRQSRAHCASIRTLTHDPAATYGISFISGASDGAIQLWDEDLKPLEERLHLHKDSVVDIARVDHYFASAAEDGSIAIWDPWNDLETEAGTLTDSPSDVPKRRIDPRMGPVLLVEACEDGKEVYALDTHGIWRWSSTGTLLSKFDFMSEQNQALGPARVVALSLAGQRAAISLADGFICVVNTSSGLVLHGPFHAHDDEVASLALSPDGELLISAAADGSVHLWATESATLIDPPGQSISTAMGSADLRSPCVAVTSSHYAHALDEVHLCARGSVEESDLVNNEACTLPNDETDMICALNFADDGSIIGACYSSGRVAVWDVHSGAVLYSRSLLIPPDSEVSHGVFNSTLKVLAYIEPDSVMRRHEYCVVSLETGEMVEVNCGSASAPACAAFSPNGIDLLLGSSDGVVRIVDYEGASGYINGPRHEDSVRALAFAPDGRHIASGDDSGRIVIWDMKINDRVGDTQPHPGDWVRALVFTPDGKYLLSAGDDCTIRGWHVPGLEEAFIPSECHTASIRALVLSSDGHTLVTVSEDTFACIWELPASPTVNPGPVHTGVKLVHPDKLLCAALSQDDASLATGSADGSVHLWLRDHSSRDVWSSKVLHSHSGPVNTLSYLPESAAFVSGGEDRALRLFDARSGAVLRTIQAHDNVVHAVSACSFVKTIFSASRDTTIRVWDTYTGEETALPVRMHTAAVLSLALSPDGRRLISGDADGRLIVHDDASSLRAWPRAFQRSAPGPSAICTVDRQGVALGAQLDEDGWLRGRRGETLLWIPPAYRSGFCGPSCSAVLGAPAVLLDHRDFVHGKAWAELYTCSHQTYDNPCTLPTTMDRPCSADG